MRFPHLRKKRIFRIFGIIGLLISIYFLVVGGILLLTNDWSKDSEGFYTTWDLQIEKDSYAIVMGPESIKMTPGRDSDFKMEALNNDPSNQIFIGIARESDIDTYLSGVEYDEITDLQVFPSRADFQNHPGSIVPGDPTTQAFWTASTYGAGTQTLNWKPDRYSLVLMNEDGAVGVDMSILVGTEAPLFLTGSILHLSVGVVALLISLLMLSASGRSRNISYPQPL